MFEYSDVTFLEEALQLCIDTMCSVIIYVLVIVVINSDIDINNQLWLSVEGQLQCVS